MKIQVTLKDPDTMHDAVADAVQKHLRLLPGDLSTSERELVADERIGVIQSRISERWMEYGEYLTVEFDTDAEPMTAMVIPHKG